MIDGAAEQVALGHSRGGYGTKACRIADGAGRAVPFALGQAKRTDLRIYREAPADFGCEMFVLQRD